MEVAEALHKGSHKKLAFPKATSVGIGATWTLLGLALAAASVQLVRTRGLTDNPLVWLAFLALFCAPLCGVATVALGVWGAPGAEAEAWGNWEFFFFAVSPVAGDIACGFAAMAGLALTGRGKPTPEPRSAAAKKDK